MYVLQDTLTLIKQLPGIVGAKKQVYRAMKLVVSRSAITLPTAVTRTLAYALLTCNPNHQEQLT